LTSIEQTLDLYPIRHVTLSLNEINEDDKRLEARFHNSMARKVRRIIKKSSYEKIPLFNPKNGFIKNAFYPNRFRRIFVDNGIPIYSPSEILFFKPKSPKFISKKTNVDFDLLKLKKKCLVLTRSGSVGNCTLVSDTLKEKIFSDDLIRMELRDEKFLGYVYTFLKSSIGKILITTSQYGSVIKHLEPEHLMAIQVPVPPNSLRNETNKIIKKVYELRDEANILLETAQKELRNELKMPPISQLRPKYFVNSSVRNFVVKTNQLEHRFDASYHIPLANEIISKIKKLRIPMVTLQNSNLSKEIILPGRFKRFYVKKEFGIPFLGSKEILQYDISSCKFLSIKKHSKRIQKELVLKENMILITRSGTIGNVVLSPKYYDGVISSEHVIRVITNEIPPGYIYTYLASDYGRVLTQRYAHGSVVDEITDEQVGLIPIPLLEPTKMNSIGKLVLKANKMRSEAYELENKAIKDVESMIMN